MLFSCIIRFRREVDVKDATAHTVFVMWDETATELTNQMLKHFWMGRMRCMYKFGLIIRLSVGMFPYIGCG